MSQRTDSSQSDASSLHYHRCWWAWCRHDFYTKQELSNHVISEHVQKARPVRLQDIHALQTAEDSYWSSLDLGSLPALPSNLLDQAENCTQTSSHHQIDIPSSLPSPPVSLPQDPVTPILRQPPTDSFADDELFKEASASSQSFNHLMPLSKRKISGTPSFVSLSSRPNTPTYDVPGSPCFDLLVTEATSWSNYLVPESEDLNDAVCNLSEDSPQVHVLNQLTQGIVGEERGQELKSRSNLDAAPQLEHHSYDQEPSPPSVQILPTNLPDSPSYLHSLAYPSTTPVARQSWYQPQRRKFKNHSASDASAGHSSSTTSPPTKAATPITLPNPSNSIPVQEIQSSNSMISQMCQPAPQSQSQFQDRSSDSSQLSSYPLVTQAPLHSQSQTQD